jgi:hypothetical protein
MKYSYIVAEGTHDIYFLAKLIKKSFGISRIIKRSLVDSFWDELIPKTFPIDDDLQKPVPVPFFLQNNDYSIALHSARGIEKIVNTLEESLSLINQSKLYSIGLILDADYKQSPSQRFQELTQELSQKQELNKFINFQSLQLGQVNISNPKFGVFIIPDNQNQGTLETILLECAKLNYPDLLESARTYTDNIDQYNLTTEDLKDFKKPSGKDKAIISTISSILKPETAIQISIRDNRWIDENTLQLPNLILLEKFITDLLV